MTGLDRSWGFLDVEAPRFEDNRHRMVVRLSALLTGCLYHPGNTPGTHFCQRLSQPQDHSAARRIMSMKNSNNTIGNRTRCLLACSAVPQPSGLRYAPPILWMYINKIFSHVKHTLLHNSKFGISQSSYSSYCNGHNYFMEEGKFLSVYPTMIK